MTRHEYAKNANKKELAKFLCDLYRECSNCPATNYCYFGHNGFLSWLDKDITDDDERDKENV